MAEKPDITPEVRRLITTAAQIDKLLAEGREFKRIDADEAVRLEADLERAMATLRDLRAELES